MLLLRTFLYVMIPSVMYDSASILYSLYVFLLLSMYKMAITTLRFLHLFDNFFSLVSMETFMNRYAFLLVGILVLIILFAFLLFLPTGLRTHFRLRLTFTGLSAWRSTTISCLFTWMIFSLFPMTMKFNVKVCWIYCNTFSFFSGLPSIWIKVS